MYLCRRHSFGATNATECIHVRHNRCTDGIALRISVGEDFASALAANFTGKIMGRAHYTYRIHAAHLVCWGWGGGGVERCRFKSSQQFSSVLYDHQQRPRRICTWKKEDFCTETLAVLLTPAKRCIIKWIHFLKRKST